MTTVILLSVSVTAVDFFNEISLLYGTITEFCTPATCPVMSAGPQYEYLWADGVKVLISPLPPHLSLPMPLPLPLPYPTPDWERTSKHVLNMVSSGEETYQSVRTRIRGPANELGGDTAQRRTYLPSSTRYDSRLPLSRPYLRTHCCLLCINYWCHLCFVDRVSRSRDRHTISQKFPASL